MHQGLGLAVLGNNALLFRVTSPVGIVGIVGFNVPIDTL